MKAEKLKEYAAKGLSYNAYLELIKNQLEQGLSTDHKSDESLLETTKVCLSRLNRLDKKLKVSDEVSDNLKSLKNKYELLIITEGWCGDASQVMPMLAKMDVLTDKFELKILIREDNLALMDAYLYKDTRSIPRMIAIDSDSGEEQFIWGPRPAPLLDLTAKFKADANYEKVDFLNDVQKWYNKDKGLTIQNEIISKLN